MAITEADDQAAGEGEDVSPPRTRRILSARNALITAAVVLVAGCGIGVAYTLGYLPGAERGEMAAPAKIYHTLPEFTVNLSSQDGRQRYLRMTVALEASDERVIEALEPRMPRVIDIFQVYLRELRVGDLEGSAGLHRLREELVRRVNMTIAPLEVDGVLFQDVLIQ